MTTKQTAENFIKNYGKDKLTRLIQLFQNDVSGTIIAKEFTVTRQRVNQWKHAFGKTKVAFSPSAELADLIKETAQPSRVTI